MKRAGSLARFVLDIVASHLRVGVETDELDRICHTVCLQNGAYPSPLNYMGFPKSICTSINEVVCHGIPDRRKLEPGDLINLDVTVCLNGYHGDLSETFIVGCAKTKDRAKLEENKRLLGATLSALEKAIDFTDRNYGCGCYCRRRCRMNRGRSNTSFGIGNEIAPLLFRCHLLRRWSTF